MYTNQITYIKPPTFSGDLICVPPIVKRIKVDAEHPIYVRARKKFSQKYYLYPTPPLFLGQTNIVCPDTETFVLRLLIKKPGQTWALPKELEWVSDFVWNCACYQFSHFPDFDKRFFYITIRSGKQRSVKDDTFHVDGFQGVLVPRHIPEQSYIWTDVEPTVFAIQPYFVEDLDPAKHNINNLFDKQTNRTNLFRGIEKGVYCFDPYVVHARPQHSVEHRTVIRLTASPVEIKDDTNTVNPSIPNPQYNKADPRNNLWDFPFENPELKSGLMRAK